MEYEFSIGQTYRKMSLIIWAVISVCLFLAGIGIIMLPIVFFYFGFYLKKANAYAFTNKRVLIHRGWLSTRTTSIDYEKITDVHIVEPFFDRILTHSGHMAINTAGSSKLEVVLLHIESPYEVKKQLDALKDQAQKK